MEEAVNELQQATQKALKLAQEVDNAIKEEKPWVIINSAAKNAAEAFRLVQLISRRVYGRELKERTGTRPKIF